MMRTKTQPDPEYVVVRRAGDDWAVFLVAVEADQLIATIIAIAEDRNGAFSSARYTAALRQVPLMGRNGLERVPALEVLF